MEAGITSSGADAFGDVSLEGPSPRSCDWLAGNRWLLSGEDLSDAFGFSMSNLVPAFRWVASGLQRGLAIAGAITGGSLGMLSSADCILFILKLDVGVCLSGSLFRRTVAGAVDWVPNFTMGKVSRIARVKPPARLCGVPSLPTRALGPYLSGWRMALIACIRQE